MMGEPDDSGVAYDSFPLTDESAAFFRGSDWSKTALGPADSWPRALRDALRLVLPSPLPTLLWWGPDLLQLYNNAARELADPDHRLAGLPAALCWPDEWGVVGPPAVDVLEGHGARRVADLLVLSKRLGGNPESYWTLQLSPIIDTGGNTAGVVVAAIEVTARVLEARRLPMLRALGSVAATEVGSAHDACIAAIDALSRDRSDLPFAAALLVDGAGLLPAGAYGFASGIGDALDAAAQMGVVEDALRVVDTGVQEHISGLDSRSTAGLIAPSPLGSEIPDQCLVVPLHAGSNGRRAGVLLLGLSPYGEFEGGYRAILEIVGRRFSRLVTDVDTLAAERSRVAGQIRLFEDTSHELRTPLTLMTNPIRELLADAAITLPQSHRLALMAADRAGERLERIVDALLDFARADAGALDPNSEATDLELLTEGLVAMFRPFIEASGLRMDVIVAPLAGPIDVDRRMWSAVVTNLLSNAAKFTAEGSITITLQPQGSDIQLVVADTGTGIPAEQVPMIFDRFFLVPGRWRRHVPGVGIGLPLVADLVQALGGRVEADSTLGQGSTFTVTLPRGTRANATRPLEPPQGGSAELLVGAGSVGGPDDEAVGSAAHSRLTGRILLVEDDDDMRRYLVRLLTADGWQVDAAASVEQALAVLTAPDLVLTDLMLHGRSGLDLLHVVRASPDLSDVPVVLLTGRAGSSNVAAGLRAGADDYIAKPFEREELLARVRVHVELSRLRRHALSQAQDRAAHLYVALDSNRRIGAAVGILMQRLGVTEDDAFMLLRNASQHTNRKLRDVADFVRRTGTLPGSGNIDRAH